MTTLIKRLRKRVVVAERDSRFGDAEDFLASLDALEAKDAEIERLRKHPTWDGYVAQQCATLLQENEGLRAEIERLRAALTQIKNLDAKHGMVNNEAKVMDAFIIALKALRLDGQVEDGSK